jgi:hypothetical protein
MFSVIVCSHRPERADFVRRHYARLFGSTHEFILIDDARSLCEGYTRGIARSNEKLLIFSHDDIEFLSDDVAERIRTHLCDFDLIGIAGTSRLIDCQWLSAGDPYCFMLVMYPEGDGYALHLIGDGPLVVPGIQALDGCFLACRREVAETVRFDSATFDGFHLYDMDFTFRACQAGFALAVCRDLPLLHWSTRWDNPTWPMYAERFLEKHAGRLAAGASVANQGIVIRGTREKLQRMCQPENIAPAIQAHLEARKN